MFLSGHPLDHFKFEIKHYGITSIQDFNEIKESPYVQHQAKRISLSVWFQLSITEFPGKAINSVLSRLKIILAKQKLYYSVMIMSGTRLFFNPVRQFLFPDVLNNDSEIEFEFKYHSTIHWQKILRAIYKAITA